MKRNEKETLLDKLIRRINQWSGKSSTAEQEPWQYVDQRYGNQRKMRAKLKLRNRRIERAKEKQKLQREPLE